MTELYQVSKLGKNLGLDNAESEYIGLAFFTSSGIEKLKLSYEKMKITGTSDSSFVDILNFMIGEDLEIHCLEFDGGWIELHTKDDFKLAEQEIGS